MTETKQMPKGWNDLSPLAKSGYVDADFVEEVDDAIYRSSLEMNKRKNETIGMTEAEIDAWENEIMRKYLNAV